MFHIPPNNVSELLWKKFHYFASRNCCEYALLRIFFQKQFFLTVSSMPVILNQYRGEIGNFYNRSASHIHRVDYFLFWYFSKFYQKCFGLYYLDSKYDFLTLLNQCSSCRIIYLRNFMTHLFYFKLQIFRESLTYSCYGEILNRIHVQDLILVKPSQFAIRISIE